MSTQTDIQNVDMNLVAGDSFIRMFTFTNTDGTPLNVSTWSFFSQVRQTYDDPTVLGNFTFSQVGLATNQVNMSMSYTTTALLPVAPGTQPGVFRINKLTYDVRAIIGGGPEITIQRGTLYVSAPNSKAV